MPDEGLPGVGTFLRALRENTEAQIALKGEVARLADEFAKLRAAAPPPAANDAAGHIAEAGGKAVADLLRDVFAPSPKKKGRPSS